METIKLLSKEDVKELVKTALTKYATRNNDSVSVDIISGVCSWGIGVCHEFSWNTWEDDCLTLCDWASTYYDISYQEASNRLDENDFPFHLIPSWEYEGEDLAYGGKEDFYPHKYTFDQLVDIFYKDYVEYMKALLKIVLTDLE